MKTAVDSEVILDALAHLICGTNETGRDISRVHGVSASVFDGFEVFAPGFGGQDDFVLLGDNVSDQPIWPLDVSTGLLCDEHTDWPPGTWLFTSLRTLRPKEWRGKIYQVYPRMIDMSLTVAKPDGNRLSVRLPFALVNGKLIDVPRANGGMMINGGAGANLFTPDPSWYGTATRTSEETDRDLTGKLLTAGGLALRRHYHWSVLIGEGKGPRARFITDPIGIREIFRLREVPLGRKRRAALLHWVREHWRAQRRPSSEDKAFIRRHLSGAWGFNWDGLRCEIEPSVEDLTWAIEKARTA